jgi:hypothetical protein
MAERTLGELHGELFNRLRATRFYMRLKNVALEPSDYSPCGWRAEVVGDFTVAEHNEGVKSCATCNHDFRCEQIHSMGSTLSRRPDAPAAILSPVEP